MSNNNTRGKLRLIIISLLAVTVFALCFSELSKPHRKEISGCIIKNTGTITYADALPPPPSSGVNYIDWLIVISHIVTVFLGVSALAKAINGLIKRYLWGKKYGKGRTPIIMPAFWLLTPFSWIVRFCYDFLGCFHILTLMSVFGHFSFSSSSLNPNLPIIV